MKVIGPSVKALRYRLHWASGDGPSPDLKWQIWDWSIKHPVAHLANRALGRQICKLLNASIEKEAKK